MSREAQLARIKAVTGDDDVKIVKLDKGMSIWFWLCGKHLAKRLANGWTHLETRPMVAKQACDDCKHERGQTR